MVEKSNKKLKAKGKATTARPRAKSNPKRKASGGSSDQVLMKARSEKIYQLCKTHGSLSQMHNKSNYPCYDKDSKPFGTALGKSSNAKKPYKKYGGKKQMAFRQIMFEAYAKAKKARKPKKCKKCEYDPSSNSE
jgi:hypothetical protein